MLAWVADRGAGVVPARWWDHGALFVTGLINPGLGSPPRRPEA
jgi:hypothetical protein